LFSGEISSSPWLWKTGSGSYPFYYHVHIPYWLRSSPTVLKSLAILKFYWALRRTSTELSLSQSPVPHTHEEVLSHSSFDLPYLRSLLLFFFNCFQLSKRPAICLSRWGPYEHRAISPKWLETWTNKVSAELQPVQISRNTISPCMYRGDEYMHASLTDAWWPQKQQHTNVVLWYSH
jgi:hypothetical protein